MGLCVHGGRSPMNIGRLLPWKFNSVLSNTLPVTSRPLELMLTAGSHVHAQVTDEIPGSVWNLRIQNLNDNQERRIHETARDPIFETVHFDKNKSFEECNAPRLLRHVLAPRHDSWPVGETSFDWSHFSHEKFYERVFRYHHIESQTCEWKVSWNFICKGEILYNGWTVRKWKCGIKRRKLTTSNWLQWAERVWVQQDTRYV